MQKLIVGLGNPGSKYQDTRHNIGWLAIDHLSFYSKLRWQEKFKGLYSSYEMNGEKIYFLMPQTFMNLSGESISKMCNFFKITPDNVLVIHDELDLPYGTTTFKKGGGLAGHNGLKSTAQCLGTKDFLRLRLGIGRPHHGNVSAWVLSKFDGDESIALDQYLNGAAEAIEYFCSAGFDKAASQYSKKKFI